VKDRQTIWKDDVFAFLIVCSCSLNLITTQVTKEIIWIFELCILFFTVVKLIVDWLVRLQTSEKSSKSLNYILKKAHTGTLIKFLNQIKIYNQQADEDLNNNFILPEEKKLIGFIPLDYAAMRYGLN
jgi:c-di-AMP phosphodiesterase-like protein